MRSVLSFVMAVAAALPAIPAQAPRSPAVSASQLPLQHGTRWTYAEKAPSIAGKPPQERQFVVVAEGTAELGDGTRVTQLRTERQGQPPTFAWLAIADGALQQLLPRDPTRRAAFDAKASGMAWLPANLRQGETWQWTGGHDLLTDTDGRTFTHTATCRSVTALVVTPIGSSTGTHVHVVSELDGRKAAERELWFAPGVGLVREHHRDDTRSWERELVRYEPAPDDAARLRGHVDAELALRSLPAWNNPPALRWHEGGPESLLVPGRIAVAEGERSSQLYYVDGGPDGIARFGIDGGDNAIGASRRAFGTDSAVPPESVPVRGLALLLARAEADRRGMLRVHEVPLTLAPKRPPATDSHRCAAVQVRGGARDGTTRNVAVFLTIRRFCDLQVATDTP